MLLELAGAIPSGGVTLLLVVFALGLAMAGYTDVRSRRVPNYLVFTLIPLGILVSYASLGWRGAEQAMLGCLVGGGLLMLPFAIGALGAGDVKLIAALGTLTGPRLMLWTFLLIMAIGVVVSLVNILYRRAARQTWTNLQLIYYRLMSLNKLLLEPAAQAPAGSGIVRDNTIPFGAIIAIAGEVVLIWSVWKTA